MTFSVVHKTLKRSFLPVRLKKDAIYREDGILKESQRFKSGDCRVKALNSK